MLVLYALIHKVRDEYTIFFDKKNVRRFKNKIVKKEIDEEIEKYITTNGTVEDDSTTHKTEEEDEE